MKDAINAVAHAWSEVKETSFKKAFYKMMRKMQQRETVLKMISFACSVLPQVTIDQQIYSKFK